MSKYRSIRYNGVTYYLVPQAKGTYALKTSDGKLAGSMPLINARNYGAAVNQARRIAKEIENETTAIQNNSTSEAITIADYNASVGDVAPKKDVPSQAVVKPTLRSRMAVALSRRPKPIKKVVDAGLNKGFQYGMSLVDEGLQGIQKDSRKDIILGGLPDQVGKAKKLSSKAQKFHASKINEHESSKTEAQMKARNARFKAAHAQNAEAFQEYKKNLLASDYKEYSVIEEEIRKATAVGDTVTVNTLMIEKNRVAKHINEFMKKPVNDFPEFSKPHPKVPEQLPSKKAKLNEKMKANSHDRRMEALEIDARRNAKKRALTNS